MATLDRYILKGLLVNYLIAIGVMMSLYIVLDLFFNMDEFTENVGGTTQILLDIASFYGNRVFLYFSQLSGVITLFACLITVSRMRQQNELTAVLASGVSLYRIAAPVLGFAIATTALWWVNTEVFIPSIAHKLARRHDDARGLKTFGVYFLQDRDNALLCAQKYVPGEEILKRVLILKRDKNGSFESWIQAEQGTWKAPVPGVSPGGWQLDRGLECKRSAEPKDTLAPEGAFKQELIDFYASNLDPQTIELRQSTSWIRFLSSKNLDQLSHTLDGHMLQQVHNAKHTRVTTPIISLLMLALGLPFVLDRIPAGVLAAGGKSLLLCGTCFLAMFLTQNLSSEGNLSALPAWIPVMVFTPISVVLFDRMRT